MKQTLTLKHKDFPSSTGKTPEFIAFTKVFRKEFQKELQSIGATDIQFSIGHFYISGFFMVEGKAWYFSISDVRFFREDKLLYRTAESYKDYTGGCNRYVTIKTGMTHNMNMQR